MLKGVLPASRAAVALGVLGALLVSASAQGADGKEFASLNAPPPELSVSKEQLRSSLSCTGELSEGQQTPVLLVPGTTVTPRKNFGWNWMPALDAIGRPHCEIELPQRSMGDIQIAGEYVVYAINSMYRRAGREIDIVGHSQGGMVPRWALRFWPKTRRKVDDLVGLAASNHGTETTIPLCLTGCPAAFHQQATGSNFMEALNSGTEAFPQIDYTALRTNYDTIVFPNTNDSGSTSLRGGTANIANVAVQDLCPLDPIDHLGIGTYDAPAYAIARDALDNPGPANLERVDASVCTEPLMPGVDALTFPTSFVDSAAFLGTTIVTAHSVPEEPELACYVTASCPSARGVRRR